MKKNKIVVTGQKAEDKDLVEIIEGRKHSKFGKYPTRKSYQDFLFELNHIELCGELLRIGQYPSTDASICRERCLSRYDASKKTVKKPSSDTVKSKSLSDIINGE